MIRDSIGASREKPGLRHYPLQPSFVDDLGALEDLSEFLVPFRDLDLRDGATRARVLFCQDDLASANRNHDGIGWILDHRPLMDVLLARLEAHGNVAMHLAEPCGTKLRRADRCC